MFFLISGFLITTLLLKEHAASGRISLPKFYMRRVIRIFPAFYVYVGVVALLALLGRIQLLPGDMAHALTYTVNYQHERSWYVNHLWSLSVEEQFYLLWPAALLLAGPRRALKGAAAAIIIVPLIRCWIYWDFAHEAAVAGQPISPYYATALDRYFQAVCDSLATGCVLAGCYEALGRVRRYIESQRQVWYPLLPLTLILASGALHKVSVPVYLILGQIGREYRNRAAAGLLGKAARFDFGTSAQPRLDGEDRHLELFDLPVAGTAAGHDAGAAFRCLSR